MRKRLSYIAYFTVPYLVITILSNIEVRVQLVMLQNLLILIVYFSFQYVLLRGRIFSSEAKNRLSWSRKEK